MGGGGVMEPEIIHVPELAKLLGRTESSIRSAIQARPDWLPPYFKQGVRVCWRLESVRKFLREYEAGEHKAVKVGRPRREPPNWPRLASPACRPGRGGKGECSA